MGRFGSITIDPYADRKDVARLIRRHDFLALPIVDDGQIIGIVTVDDVIDALIDEASEDLGRFGGGLSDVYSTDYEFRW